MRGWLTGIATALVLLWLTLLSTVMVTSADPSTEPGFEFVPADGSSTRIALGSDQRPASREHALIKGDAILFGAAIGAISRTDPPPGTDPENAWWWRESTALARTDQASAGDRFAGVPADPVRHSVRSVSPDGLRLHAVLGTEDGVVFNPALLELPTGAHVGQSWSSEGTREQANGAFDYRNDSTATEPLDPELADAGCLQVTSRTTVKPRAETPSDAIVPAPRSDVATWCPHRGIVEGTPTNDEPIRPFEGTWPPGTMKQTSATGPRDPAGLPRLLPTASREPAFGAAALAVPGGLDSSVTTDGTVVRANPATQGLTASRIGTDPSRGDELQALWWAKPPGKVLTLTTFDDIIVVTTSTRDVVAYESTGRRLWRVPTADLILQPPARLDRNRFVATDAQGEVIAIDMAGKVSWTHQASAQAAPLLTTDAGEVYVSTGAGGVERLDSEGRSVWQETIDSSGPAPLLVQPVGSMVLLGNGAGGFTELDRATGKRRRDYVAGNAHSHQQLVLGGDRVALSRSASGVQILDPQTGKVTGTVPGGRAAHPVTGGWFVATDDALVRTDAGGTEIGRQPLAAPRPGAGLELGISDGALWLFHTVGDVEVVK